MLFCKDHEEHRMHKKEKMDFKSMVPGAGAFPRAPRYAQKRMTMYFTFLCMPGAVLWAALII